MQRVSVKLAGWRARVIDEASVIVIKRRDTRAVMYVKFAHLFTFWHVAVCKEAKTMETRPTNS